MSIMLVLAIIIGAGVVSLANILYLRWVYERERQRIESLVLGFVSPGNDGGPSALAGLCENVAQMVGRAVATQIKTSLMGQESGLARSERGMAADIMADTNPALGALMSAFPKLSRRITKQPELAAMALEMLGKMSAKKNGGGSGSTQQIFPM